MYARQQQNKAKWNNFKSKECLKPNYEHIKFIYIADDIHFDKCIETAT